ncbi:6-phosphogluconolactonase [Streptomyces sp. SID13031]|uniref:6-phosphogluconolactonase n=1 Tax=Streptomyces sp. SID13031 TaxID=2706046 RepID=UPI0013CCE03A|nr:6-phosphogluconolactonase [Streptomyces sp. SID13031]NEA30852.1 6-phosphogluconolactonase [Streptomyces sp. SID13031]
MSETALNTIPTPPPRSILINRDAEGLAHAVAARLITKLIDVQSNGGVAQVVLTGGRVAAVIYRAVAESPARSAIDWRRVEFWWGDERFLPEGDPERNDTQAWDALLSHVDVDPALVHSMPADTGQGAEAAAEAYAVTLAATAGPDDGDGVPAFDVLMLGVGPDGHVASLFPENPARVVVETSTVAVFDSPKPPPTRVSLTFPALANSRETWFVVSGEDKAEAVADALSGTSDLPAAIPKGLDRTLWIIDEAAASQVS